MRVVVEGWWCRGLPPPPPDFLPLPEMGVHGGSASAAAAEGRRASLGSDDDDELSSGVAAFLSRWSLAQHASRFREMEIESMDTLAALTDDDISAVLGHASVQDRNRLRRGLGRPCEVSPPASAEAEATASPPTQQPAAAAATSASASASAATATPGMARYAQLLRTRGRLLERAAGGQMAADTAELRAVDAEIERVARELRLEGMPLVTPRRGDKVRIIGYAGCSPELRRLSGSLGTVVSAGSGGVDGAAEVFCAVTVRLAHTGDSVMVPPHCVQHVAESRLAQRYRHLRGGSGGSGEAAGSAGGCGAPPSTAPDTVRRAVARERSVREDPFTLQGMQTDPIYGRLLVEVTLRPEVSAAQILPVIKSASWGGRGVLLDTVVYHGAPHCVRFDMLSGKLVHRQLESELNPMCLSFSVRRKGGCEKLAADPAAAASSCSSASPAAMAAAAAANRPSSASAAAASTADSAAGLPNPNPSSAAAAPAADPPTSAAAGCSSSPSASGAQPPALSPFIPPPQNEVPVPVPVPAAAVPASSVHAQSMRSDASDVRSNASSKQRAAAARSQNTPQSTPLTAAAAHARRTQESKDPLFSLRRASGASASPSYCGSLRSGGTSSVCGASTAGLTGKKLAPHQVEDELRIRLKESQNRCVRLKVCKSTPAAPHTLLPCALAPSSTQKLSLNPPSPPPPPPPHLVLPQHEIQQYKLKEKKTAKSLNLHVNIANTCKTEADTIRKKTSTLNTELGKLKGALEVVLSTLSACSGQWAEQLALSGNEEGARLSRGVIAEVIATNHEIREKMRHINVITNMAGRVTDEASFLSPRQAPSPHSASLLPDGSKLH